MQTLRDEKHEIDTTFFTVFYVSQNFVLPFSRFEFFFLIFPTECWRFLFVLCLLTMRIFTLVTHAAAVNLLSSDVYVFRTRIFNCRRCFYCLFVLVNLQRGWNFILPKVRRFYCYLSFVS
jgi:hypothetical protein